MNTSFSLVNNPKIERFLFQKWKGDDSRAIFLNSFGKSRTENPGMLIIMILMMDTDMILMMDTDNEIMMDHEDPENPRSIEKTPGADYHAS